MPTFYPWHLGPRPTPVICPKCKSPVISHVDFETETTGCGVSILMCILMAILFIICIIFAPIACCCIYSRKQEREILTHRCPECKGKIGLAVDYRPELRNKSITGNQALVDEIKQTKINILARIPKNKLRNTARTVRPQDRNASKEIGTLEAIRIAKQEKEQTSRTNQEIILKVEVEEEDKNDSKMTSNQKEGNLNNGHTNVKNIQIKKENNENEENIKL